MSVLKRAGRVVGLLVILQMAIGAYTNFGLLDEVFSGPGFLGNASAHSCKMTLAALLGIAGGLISVGIAVPASDVPDQSAGPLASFWLVVAASSLPVHVGESISVMSLLSLSEAFAKASDA